MIALNTIIESFSSEERQGFVKYLQQKNKRKDTKNIQLFKLLAQGETNKAIQEKLYPGKGKDAYHALRKRLHHSLLDFIANKTLTEENSEEMLLRKELIAAQYFFKQQQYKTALQALTKTERKAIQLQHFGLLNEIYQTKIQYAYLQESESLESLIECFKKNQTYLRQEEQLNLVYASVRKLLTEVIYKSKVIPVKEEIEGIFEKHNISLDAALTYKSLYQLAQILNTAAYVTKEYFAIDQYLLEKYQFVNERTPHIEKQLFYHIQILYFIANSFFRNKKFEEANSFLDEMWKQMQLQQKKYLKAFLHKHHLLLALIQNYSGKAEKAMETLQPITKRKTSDIETQMDIQMAAMVFNFQQGKLSETKKILSKIYHTDKWLEEKAGVEYAIQKNLIELLLHIELGNIDYVDARFLSFQRKYKNYLTDIGETRVLSFLHFIKKYYQNPENVHTKEFFQEVENAFDFKPRFEEDIFVMSFFAWLKAKMQKSDLYTTTLELMHNEQKNHLS